MAGIANKERFARLRDAIGRGLVERDVAARLVLLSALAGEHLLLLGPPGTAKSMLARRLRRVLDDDRYFEHLLTRFSVPEELFGPLSIKSLEQDEYRRQTEGYLPTASIAFLDEIFKANSAILNALLTLLNEREFDNGAGRTRTPLVTVIGASNELPEGDELDALYDRFLLRFHVASVSDKGFDALLDLKGAGDIQVEAFEKLDAAELEAVRDAAERIMLPPPVRELLRRARQWTNEQQLTVSDRRWRKIVHLLRVAALTDGRNEVSVWDCSLLQHCLWQKPEQRASVEAWYGSLIGSTELADPEQLTSVVVAWESQLTQDMQSQSQARNAKGELLYNGPQGPTTSARDAVNKQLLAHLEPTRYSAAHLRECLGQLEQHLHVLTTYEQALHAHQTDLKRVIGQHLWIDPALAEPATRAIKKLGERAAVLRHRLSAVHTGYQGLPRLPEAVAPPPRPAPVASAQTQLPRNPAGLPGSTAAPPGAGANPVPATPGGATLRSASRSGSGIPSPEPSPGEQLAAAAVGALLSAGIKHLGKKMGSD